MRDNVVLAGSLKFLSLGDVLQLLGANNNSGVLRLISRFATEPGFIYIQNGNPINATCGSKTGLDAIYALFGWLDGEFEFANESVTSEKTITKGRMGIILEGLKMVDDGQIKKIGAEAQQRNANASVDPDSVALIKGPLVDYMYVADEEDFFDGEFIVEEGKHGSWIWVILEGVVEIVKDSPKGPIPIIRLGDGSFIGSIASFLIQGHIRTASAVAVGNVQLGVLDSQRLAQEFAQLGPEFRGLLISLDRRLKQLNGHLIGLRMGQPIDNSLDDQKKKIIEQGTSDDSLYLVREGSASMVREEEDGRSVLLGHLNKGDYFGRIPFLDVGQEPELASVYASSDFNALKVDTTPFQHEYNQLSTTFRNFVDNVATCISVSSNTVCSIRKN
jgi:CRP-like cAMP-binding protein